MLLVLMLAASNFGLCAILDVGLILTQTFHSIYQFSFHPFKVFLMENVDLDLGLSHLTLKFIKFDFKRDLAELDQFNENLKA